MTWNSSPSRRDSSLPLSSPEKCSDFKVSCRMRSRVSPDASSVWGAAGNGTTFGDSAIVIMGFL